MANLIIDEGSQRDRKSLPLVTRKRTYIRNVQRPEMPAERMRAAENIWLTKFPQNKTRSLSATYNCYGLVFASRRTHVLDENEVETILKEDEYALITDRSKVAVGDLVIYRNQKRRDITHVGIIVEIVCQFEAGQIEFIVMSQWGSDGEYIHKEDSVPPLYGVISEYYSDRKLV